MYLDSHRIKHYLCKNIEISIMNNIVAIVEGREIDTFNRLILEEKR
jgi:hypothetical protein